MYSHHSWETGYPKFGWDVSESSSLCDIARVITKNVYSNAIWAGNVRLEANFTLARFCVLDYDEGVTKKQAIELFKDFAFVLGPTKSDGVVKQKTERSEEKPACDRFRVVIPFKEPIYELDVFKYNMKLLVEKYRSDAQCVDAAKAWQRCKSLEYEKYQGASLEVVRDIPDEETTAYKNEQIEKRMARYRETKTLPRRIMYFLRHGAAPGERNKELFYAAITLLQYGHTFDAVAAMLRHVPGLDGHDGFDDTLKSAARRCGLI